MPRARRLPYGPLLLAGLGAAAFWLGPPVARLTHLPLLGFGPLVLVGVLAGAWEAQVARQTGVRHRVGAWGWPVLGLLLVTVGTFAWEATRGPWHVDSGMAWGIYLAMLVVVVPLFAGLVLGVAALLHRARLTLSPCACPPRRARARRCAGRGQGRCRRRGC